MAFQVRSLPQGDQIVFESLRFINTLIINHKTAQDSTPFSPIEEKNLPLNGLGDFPQVPLQNRMYPFSLLRSNDLKLKVRGITGTCNLGQVVSSFLFQSLLMVYRALQVSQDTRENQLPVFFEHS